MRMNKRGEEESSKTGAIIAVVIAVAVLVIVIYFGYNWFSGKGIPFFQYLPSFNQTKPRVIELEKFAYFVADDKLKFYDSVHWVDVPKSGVEANGRVFDYLELRYKLTDDFFRSINSANVAKAITGKMSAAKIHVVFPGRLGLDSSVDYLFDRSEGVWKYNGGWGWGKVKDMGRLYLDKHRAVAGSLEVYNEAEGYLFFTKLREAFPSVKSISGIPYGWFDSFLSNSAIITYKYANGVEDKVTTCYYKDYYQAPKWGIVVDLSQPEGLGEKCPY